MITNYKESTWFIGLKNLAFPLAILSLIAPICQLQINGLSVYQYPLSGYLGKVVFGVILVAAALSWYPVLKKNSPRIWPYLLAGLVLMGFTMMQYQQIMQVFEPAENNLTELSGSTIMLHVGWYGCLFAAILLLASWGYGRSVFPKNPSNMITPS